ncbi:MAG: hypothetical protein A3B70_06630 [Deltaproteobacteria bacterium RIFCSPHIGHO2_02_FULL_40_11]|nr:MAG: hypothetical protein A3B70_06630 [Deltaproteobacteria bacterium RIFCSPHIGHO2_02_FULL_40_11]
MSYFIQLDTFEGPLDLLLYLIRKNEMDICEIEISKITQQYLDFINAMRVLDVDLASEFIVMAATLIYIKSKLMLPKPELEEGEVEEDPREALIRRLLEYQKYKWAAEELEKKPYLGEDIHRVQISQEHVEVDFDPQTGLKEVGVFELALVFHDILKRSQKTYHEVEYDVYNIEDKILEMVEILKSKFNERVLFHTLFSKEASKGEIVVTFLAILELTKMGYFQLFQANFGSELYVKTIKSFDQFRLDQMELTG